MLRLGAGRQKWFQQRVEEESASYAQVSERVDRTNRVGWEIWVRVCLKRYRYLTCNYATARSRIDIQPHLFFLPFFSAGLITKSPPSPASPPIC